MANIRKAKESIVLDIATHIIGNYNYEAVIPYNVLERISGIDKDTSGFMYVMAQVKNILTNYGIVLVCIADEGYKILAPNQISDYVINKYLIKSVGMLDRGRNIVHYINRNDLTKEECEKADKVEKFIAELQKDNEDKIASEGLLLSNARVRELN
jgi:hypothetical protein